MAVGFNLYVAMKEITQHVQDNQGVRPSQHIFMKGRSFLINLISFYEWVTLFVNEGKAVDVVYLVFSKAFNIVSSCIIVK